MSVPREKRGRLTVIGYRSRSGVSGNSLRPPRDFFVLVLFGFFCFDLDSIALFYFVFDCFLFPSLWEGLPLSLIEAQASGLACVASDVIDEGAFVCD